MFRCPAHASSRLWAASLLLGQHWEDPGPGLPFPVPLSQHQGLGKGQVCLCISALARAFHLRCFSERTHAGVTLGRMLAKQETQP